MKKYRLNELPPNREGHFLKGLIPGEFINKGGVSFPAPGFRVHTNEGPGGSDEHIHTDHCEVFVMLGGKARMEMDEGMIPLCVGDVLIIEPGENHHMISDEEDPSVHIWLQAGDERRK
jgi:mannose-6-phosphate isomerase-like protein (cupin superfamily)